MTTPVRGAELWRRVMDARLQDVHTALPGKVVSFDASTQTIEVQPQIKNVLVGEETEVESSYPRLYNVPVIYPRTAATVVAFPLAADDIVTLIFNEWPIDAFREKGKETHPIDFDRHGFGGAVAIPGGPYANADPVGETIDGLIVGYDGGMRIKVKSDGTMEITSDGGTTQQVALAADTKAEIKAVRDTLDTLVTDVNALKTVLSVWIPVPTDGGAALKTAATVWFGASAPAPGPVGDVGSTKVEVEE